jgi:hypothetical protein
VTQTHWPRRSAVDGLVSAVPYSEQRVGFDPVLAQPELQA